MKVPLWIIAGVMCALLLVVLVGLGDRWYQGWREEQRRAELLRKEPWRRYVSEPYRYDPNYRGDY